MFLEASGKLHFCCTAASDNGIGLEAPSDDHDGIVERAFCLFDELLSATPENDGCRFGLNVGGGTLGQSSKRL